MYSKSFSSVWHVYILGTEIQYVNSFDTLNAIFYIDKDVSYANGHIELATVISATSKIKSCMITAYNTEQYPHILICMFTHTRYRN